MGYNCFSSHVLLTSPLFGGIKGANCFHILSPPPRQQLLPEILLERQQEQQVGQWVINNTYETK